MQAVRLVADSQKVQVDLTATISQLEANIDLPPEAFRVVVPPNTGSLTLEELRESGPLRVR